MVAYQLLSMLSTRHCVAYTIYGRHYRLCCAAHIKVLSEEDDGASAHLYT